MKDEDGAMPDEQGEALPPPVSRGLPPGARRVAILAALLLVPALFGAWSLLGVDAVLGVLGGGLLAMGNFWALARIVVQVTSGEDIQPLPLLARLLLKLGVLGACLFVMVVALGLDLLGLVVGLSVVVVAAVLSAVLGLLD